MVFVVLLVIDSFVFFFKQKTAYEMRISDWSSDVCSSDLHFIETGFIAAGFISASEPAAPLYQRFSFLLDLCQLPQQRFAHQPALPAPPRDGKSFVEGKSVSVRVDLGGLRTMKKKKVHSTDRVRVSINNRTQTHENTK